MPQLPKAELVSIEYVPSKGRNAGKVHREYFYKGAIIVWLHDTAIKDIIDKSVNKLIKNNSFWEQNLWQGIDPEGGVKFPQSKKPEKLLERILKMSTKEDDLVLDSFAGSGTTGAVAHKMRRKWLMVEVGRHTEEKIIPRLQNIIFGKDLSGVSKDMDWKGGGGYTNDKGFLNAGYYGSFFDNHVNTISWQNWADPTKSATISNAPSNEFNQFSLTGGYNFTPSTKLVMNGSYARSTQNQAFFTDASTPVMSRTSLDGLVVTKAFNMKLTAKPVQDLNVSGGYKFEDRDNQTPVSIFGYYDANEQGASTLNTYFKTALATLTGLNLNSTALGSNLNINASRPYSKKSQQVNLYGDYMVKQGQWLGAGYDWQGIDRKCDGSWISCVDSDSSNEHTLKFDWRTSAFENVTTKLDYAYSKRTVDYNENAFLALVPMANVAPTSTNASAYATMTALGFSGYGPA